MPRDIPPYLVEQTALAIRNRMRSAISSEYDVSDGSFFDDILGVYGFELAIVNSSIQGAFLRTFVTANGAVLGEWLDLKGEESGIPRRDPAKATGVITFTGTDGTVVPKGTTVATVQSAFAPSQVFITQAQVTIPTSGGSTGTVDVAVEARDGGTAGNVGANKITSVTPAVSGISAVTNGQPTVGGTDTENDTDYLERYLIRRRNPTTSGNLAHYVNWSLEVPGVGAVSVVPVRDGPGTVSVAVVDTNRAAADQVLIDRVQDYIAPPYRGLYQAEDFTLTGFGASLDLTQTDDIGSSVKFVFNGSGNGIATQVAPVEAILMPAGVYLARIRLKRGATIGTGNLLTYGVYNVSEANWARKTPADALGTAVKTITRTPLSTNFSDFDIMFYWNGSDELELRVTRLTTDSLTEVWLDSVNYISTFSTDEGTGRAPVGATVLVESGKAIKIYVEADIVVDPIYEEADVIAAVKDNIIAYLNSLVFQPQNDVFHSKIGNEIIDTVGITDYSNLKIGIATPVPGAGTSNIFIDVQEFAMADTSSITLST